MRHPFLLPGILVILNLLAACATLQAQTTPVPANPPQEKLPNPAAAFCEQQGYMVEIRTAADGSQSGVCIFPDGSECDEWAFYRGECKPIPATTIPEMLPTPVPIDPAEYQQGWWTYTHAGYGFSIMLPEDWSVDEANGSDPLMNGHLLTLHPSPASSGEAIRMTFRRAGEDTLLWPTGVGQGEFVPNGSLQIAGEGAQRVLLVCPTGDVSAIWYHQAERQPNIALGGLEFGFIFTAGSHCEAGRSLTGKLQRVGEMIIASLTVP